MDKRRVVVTGMGMISPLGATMESTWEGILAGRSGIKPIESFDTEGYPVRFGGAVPDFDMSEYLSPKDARRMD
ncbi:MAG: beta-ketoacyl-ACP synthase II, partial [Pseudomonadales bacterium]|nr:beta-ketoacyl-ACP synthase II [Pseudomonadales bacterium]